MVASRNQNGEKKVQAKSTNKAKIAKYQWKLTEEPIWRLTCLYVWTGLSSLLQDGGTIVEKAAQYIGHAKRLDMYLIPQLDVYYVNARLISDHRVVPRSYGAREPLKPLKPLAA